MVEPNYSYCPMTPPTYNLGDFRVTPSVLTHTLPEGAPVMPALPFSFMRNEQFAHEVLMTFRAVEVPEISRAPLVTDGTQ